MEILCRTPMLFGALLAAAWSGSAEKVNPLGQTITLLTELSARITKAGDAEAKAYDEYSKWCADVSKQKGFELRDATAQKEKLEARITDLSSQIDVADSKVEDLVAAIAATTGELTNATQMRKREAADFVSGESELLSVIDTLGRAIDIIAEEVRKNPEALVQVGGSRMQSALQSLSVLVDATAISVADKGRLLALVQSQQADDDDGEDAGAPAAAVYTTQSNGILNVLEDLKDKAEGHLSELRKSEVGAQHHFALLKQALEERKATDTSDLGEEKADKAAAGQSKAAAEGDLQATTADLNQAKAALESTQKGCMQVAEDHEATVKSRAEELKAIQEAIAALESSTSGAFAHTYAFIQTGASHAGTARAEGGLTLTSGSSVVVLLRRLARQHHSAALAQLVSRIGAIVRYGEASGDKPFAKVRGLIEELIAKLQAAAGAEAEEKAYCDGEMAKTATRKSELDAEVSKLTTRIDQDAARSAELKEEVRTCQEELAVMAQEQAESERIRQESHADYLKTKADLEMGLSGVRKAMLILRDYYGAASGDDAALIQSDAQFASFMRQPDLPEKHVRAVGSGTGIIGLLEVVESDLAADLAKEETAESSAQEAYEEEIQGMKVTKASKDQDIKYKTKAFTSLDNALAELASDRESANAELAAVLEYEVKLKERCVAKPEMYEERRARRGAEIAGLKEALAILKGEESALVQRTSERRQRRGDRRGVRGAALSVANDLASQ